MEIRNLLAGLPGQLDQEQIDVLAGGGDMRIERIVSTGQATPDRYWYDQQTDEFVLLLKGAAELEFEDGSQLLNAGDWLLIQAHCRHRVMWTTPDEPTVWLTVHAPGL